MPARQINLLPKQELEETLYGKLLKFFLTYGRYIIVCTQLIVLLAFFSRFKLDREYTDLQDSIEGKREIIKYQLISNFEAEMQSIQARLIAIKKFKQNHTLLKKTLTTLQRVIPPGTVLKSLRFKPKEVAFTGVSENEESLAALLNSVHSAKELRNVTINKINKQAQSGKIDFSLVVEINPAHE